MPLSALLDGEPVISVLMLDEQWTLARGVKASEEQRLRIAHTNAPAFARTSAQGLRHFAHRKGYAPDSTWAESAEHLSLKAEVVRILAAAGAQVDTEVPSGPGREWIADVLAEYGGRRIAFEVQWSKQNPEEYVRRQARYAADGIKCVWFARHEVQWWQAPEELHDAVRAVPVFHLADPAQLSARIQAREPDLTSGMHVRMPVEWEWLQKGDTEMPLAEAVDHVLAGQVGVQASVALTVYRAACYHCRRPAIYWYLAGSGGWAQDRVEGQPAVIELVRETRDLIDGSTPLARLELRSGSISGTPFMAFCCPHCTKFQGDSYETNRRMDALMYGEGYTLAVPLDTPVGQLSEAWHLDVAREVASRQ